MKGKYENKSLRKRRKFVDWNWQEELQAGGWLL
jgi:hypothetical protein